MCSLDFEFAKKIALSLDTKIGNVKYHSSTNDSYNNLAFSFGFNSKNVIWKCIWDEKYLNDVLTECKDTYFGSVEKKQFFQSIYLYNQKIAPEKRITIIGIDIEHQVNLSCRFIFENIQNRTFPSGLSGPLTTFTQYYTGGKIVVSDLKKCMFDLDSAISRDTSAAQTLFDTNYVKVSLVIKNILFRLNWDGVANRDYQILQTFKKIYETSDLSDAKFYGHWGRAHIITKTCLNTPRIAELLNDNDQLGFKGKVLSIPIFYYNCATYDRRTKVQYTVTAHVMSIGPLLKCSESSLTLFDLSAPGSPYNNKLNLVENSTDGGTTLDYFKMCLLAQHWRAEVPY